MHYILTKIILDNKESTLHFEIHQERNSENLDSIIAAALRKKLQQLVSITSRMGPRSAPSK